MATISRFALAVVLTWGALSPEPVSSACTCGPDFCPGDPRYPGVLTSKKEALKKAGYPQDLIALVDRDGACVARVERAPDGFSLRTIKGSDRLTLPWTEDDERIAREQLLAGTIDVYYKFNAARAFVCCNEKEPEQRADWDASAELSKSQVVECKKKDGGVVCR